MEFFSKLKINTVENLNKILPSFTVFDITRSLISEALAERIHNAACTKAQEIIAQTHRSVIVNIIWQNGLLLSSLIPVHLMHSAIPFYLSYTIVFAYSAYSIYQIRKILSRIIATKSLTETISFEVQMAIKFELMQRVFFERKAVEWFGPDLKNLSDKVAAKIKPDILMMCTNISITLFIAFIAFRLYIIPSLEISALK